jgi:hypothetical protein
MEDYQTEEEAQQHQRELQEVTDLRKKGFFDRRVENNAVKEGFKVEDGIIIYNGGGNS